MDGISLESLRQKSSKGFEFAVKKVKPPPWK